MVSPAVNDHSQNDPVGLVSECSRSGWPGQLDRFGFPETHALVPRPPAKRRGARPGRRRRVLRVASDVVFVGLVLAGWFVYLRPQSLGGTAEFVIVKGTSMRPTLSGGDLVVVRKHGTYRVGDVVAYRVPKGGAGAGAKLIHRIVAGSAREGFRFRGDNRASDDLWRLRPSQILG